MSKRDKLSDVLIKKAETAMKEVGQRFGKLGADEQKRLGPLLHQIESEAKKMRTAESPKSAAQSARQVWDLCGEFKDKLPLKAPGMTEAQTKELLERLAADANAMKD